MLGWLRVIEFHLKKKFGAKEGVVDVPVGVGQQLSIIEAFLMELIAVNLCAKLDHVAEVDRLFRVSYEESFCHKGSGLIENLRLYKPVKRCFSFIVAVRPRLMVIRVGVVYFFSILIVNLEFDKIDALLKKINVSEVLKVQYEFSARPICHYINNYNQY